MLLIIQKYNIKIFFKFLFADVGLKYANWFLEPIKFPKEE
jgi:hypothetical protein